MRHTVLIAHESETIRESIRVLVPSAGYSARAVADGRQAVVALSDTPDVLVLDVAVSEVHAYQVLDEVRRLSPKTKVLLVASIYNRTGYKRRPTSLYGADDYIEQHHIPDLLLHKLEQLLG